MALLRRFKARRAPAGPAPATRTVLDEVVKSGRGHAHGAVFFMAVATTGETLLNPDSHLCRGESSASRLCCGAWSTIDQGYPAEHRHIDGLIGQRFEDSRAEATGQAPSSIVTTRLMRWQRG